MNKTIFVLPLFLLMVVPTLVSAKQSDTNRYDVGYTDGSNAAASDSLFNAACDPNNEHLQNGHSHTVPYCNGWTAGYNIAWNANHNTVVDQTQVQQSKQTQSQRQTGGICIAITCGQSQSQQGVQGQTQGATQP